MRIVRDLAVWVYVLGAAVLLGGTIYQMMVVVPAFAHDLPGSMVAFNETAVKPPAFWTSALGPVTALAGIAAVVASRGTPAFRWLLVSVVLAFLAEIVTIVWVWPMLRAMGIIAGPTKPVADAALSAVTTRWILVDRLRCLVMVIPSMVTGLVGFQRLRTSR